MDFIALMRAPHELYYYYVFDKAFNVLREKSPTKPSEEMAAYLRALFGKESGSSAILEAFHSKYSVERPLSGQVTIDLLTRGWVV